MAPIPTDRPLFQQEGSVASILVDGVEQSRIDLDRPNRLEFEYMQQMDVVLSLSHPEPNPIRAVHIGGCGCALAWAWHLLRPGSRQLAVEVDRELAEKVREWLPLPRKPHLRIRVGDGREVLQGSMAKYDVLIRDAFLARSVPAQLQTEQWANLAASRLTPSGLYLANAAHGGGSDSRPDVAATLRAFKHVALIGESKVLKSARWGNLTIAAWNDAGLIDVLELDRRMRRLPLPVQVFTGNRLLQWLAGRAPAQDPTAPQQENN